MFFYISLTFIAFKVLCSAFIWRNFCQKTFISGLVPSINSSFPCISMRSKTIPMVILWVSNAG